LFLVCSKQLKLFKIFQLIKLLAVKQYILK